MKFLKLFKKEIIAPLCMLLILNSQPLTAGTYNTSNLTANNSFEHGDDVTADDWTFTAGANCAVNIKTENPAEGLRYIQIIDESASATAVVRSKVIPALPGELVSVSIKAMSNENIFKAIRFISSDTEYAGANIISTETVGAATIKGASWKDAKGQYVVPEGAKGLVVIIYTISNRTGSGYIDDINLQIGGTPYQEGIDYFIEDYNNLINAIDIVRTVFYEAGGQLLAFSGLRGEISQLVITDVLSKSVVRQVPIIDGNYFESDVRGMVHIKDNIYICGERGNLFRYSIQSDELKFLTTVPRASGGYNRGGRVAGNRNRT